MNNTPLRDLVIHIVDNRGRTPPLVKNGYELIETASIVGDTKFSNYAAVRKQVSIETYNIWFRAGHPIKDDILIATVGANIGNLCIMDTNRGCVAQNLVGLRIDQTKADPHYIYYYMSEAQSQKTLKNLDIGVAQPSIKVPHLLDFKISLPPLETQRRIAAILSAYDDLIENNTRRIQALEQAAHDLYHEWFVEFRFPGHESVEMVDSGTDYEMIPRGWEVVLLGELSEQRRDSVHPDDIDSQTPYVGLAHIPQKSIILSEWGEAGETKSTKLIFKQRDILFAKIRPYLHKVVPAPIDGVSSSDAIIIRPFSSDCYGLILMCVSDEMFVDYADKTSQGTQMPRANWDVLAEYPLAVPPQDLLYQFNEFVIDLVDQTRNMIFRNNALREARDLLLPRLVSGQLDVSDVEINI